ncbi:Subtilisin-like protease [Quillaja saponaria]|uniref:Subtilisin-like protease n=1 Tax=Quillaja saponaria TaxID=32244 RepID=A0AAD7KXY3_QUISA|nr:Subtilisin-like protease [Quillaja saponaria]
MVFKFLLVVQSYIVYLGGQSYGPNPSTDDLESVANSHYYLLGSLLGSEEKAKESIFYSYNRYINGFAAELDEEEAAEIAKNPNVVSVFLNKARELHTTRSWDFLAVERNGVVPKGSIWEKARFGEDAIIGNLDTGVWPESKSFNDGGMGPIPSRWRGICQNDYSHDSLKVPCNRKLIGARFFNRGYQQEQGKPLNASFRTAWDHSGHGSHTLSTAAGNFVPGVNIFGNGNGTASGGSPKARVVAYKVCWKGRGGCFDSDIMAAFEAAISDGVDVLSVSLGGGEASEFFEDGISIGAFHAIMNGISVVTSAGNTGPSPGTVSNVAPWMFTVGASTTDREFASYVVLGDKKQLKGESLSATGLTSRKFYPLIRAADAKAANVTSAVAVFCKEKTLDPKKVKGKIVVCLRGESGRAEKGQIVANAGAAGMILANNELNGNGIIADPHVLPASHINFTDGQYVNAYINHTKNPVAYIASVRTELGVKPAPVMASFSSRGPNSIVPSILKPDITAPGVNIIAAYTEGPPTGQTFDKRRISFKADSGTSMACPHISGIVGLIKTLHPDWSPAVIKSAIMTTASTQDNSHKPIQDSSRQKATPFAYGAGHVQPNLAMNPGLVYDLTSVDYMNFLCARGYNPKQLKFFFNKPYHCPKSYNLADFNYPSITVPDLHKEIVNVTRIVTNVGSPGTYKVQVNAPAGVLASVEPSFLTFKKLGEKKKFMVSFKAKVNGKPADYAFGDLVWSDGKHNVRSPIVVKLN